MLARILENIEANEGLYENIEVTLTENYIDYLASRKGADPREFASGNYLTYAKTSRRIFFVAQDGMFRIDIDGEATVVGGRKYSMDHKRAFDGELTRLFDQGKIGNIIHGRAEHPDYFRPHMMIFRASHGAPPGKLSTWLRGMTIQPAGHKSSASGKHSSDSRHELYYDGECNYGGLSCCLLRVLVRLSNGTEYAMSKIWVCPERNYIPVRTQSYAFLWSRDLACSDGHVQAWKELGPGIWVPTHVQVTRYVSPFLKRMKKQIPHWRRECVIQEVSLNPHYPRSFFQDIQFPDGTPVYEIVDGKIVRSYVKGKRRGG